MPTRKKISRIRASKDQPNKSAQNTASQNSSARTRRENLAAATTFAAEFSHQMKQHGDNHRTLLRAIAKPREGHANMLLAHWARGKTTPRWPSSFELLDRIERHYHLPKGHFLKLIQPESPMRAALKSVSLNQQHVLRWHLPDDFDSRSLKEREKILTWTRRNVLTGATDFGKFLQRTSKKRYGIRFSELGDVQLRKKPIARYAVNGGLSDSDITDQDFSASDEAPPRLIAELDTLIRFKRATIALPGFRRTPV